MTWVWAKCPNCGGPIAFDFFDLLVWPPPEISPRSNTRCRFCYFHIWFPVWWRILVDKVLSPLIGVVGTIIVFAVSKSLFEAMPKIAVGLTIIALLVVLIFLSGVVLHAAYLLFGGRVIARKKDIQGP